MKLCMMFGFDYVHKDNNKTAIIPKSAVCNADNIIYDQAYGTWGPHRKFLSNLVGNMFLSVQWIACFCTLLHSCL